MGIPQPQNCLIFTESTTYTRRHEVSPQERVGCEEEYGENDAESAKKGSLSLEIDYVIRAVRRHACVVVFHPCPTCSRSGAGPRGAALRLVPVRGKYPHPRMYIPPWMTACHSPHGSSPQSTGCGRHSPSETPLQSPRRSGRSPPRGRRSNILKVFV